jgi:hypothetical protein
MDSKQQSNFENCLDEKAMIEVLGEGKITLLCMYTCYCYEDCPRSSEVYDLHADGVITGRDVVAFLTQIRWDPVCNHRFLESFVEIRPGLFEMFMGS